MNKFNINLIIFTLVGIITFKNIHANTCSESIISALDGWTKPENCLVYAYIYFSVDIPEKSTEYNAVYSVVDIPEKSTESNAVYSVDDEIAKKSDSLIITVLSKARQNIFKDSTNDNKTNFPKMYIDYLYSNVNTEKVPSPAEFCTKLSLHRAHASIVYTDFCKKTLNERGFNQKWGVQAFEFALYHWVYNSKHDDKYSEVWTYFFHMISVVVFDLNQRLASPSEWCGDNKMKNIRPTSIEFCQEQLTMDFGGYVTPLNCAKFAFLNLSFNELKDISKKYATYLFNYIEKNDMTIPETHCDVLAGELSNNPQYFEKYKSVCLNEILAKGFNRTDGNQCFELAFKFRKVKSMAKTSFLWDFCVSLIPNEQFESLHEALDIYHWCENENLINK